MPSRGADAKGAELASHKADVGEVDVAGDDVADDVSHKLTADFVGGHREAEEVISASRGEKEAFVAGEDTAVERVKDFLERGARGGRDLLADISPR